MTVWKLKSKYYLRNFVITFPNRTPCPNDAAHFHAEQPPPRRGM